VVTAATDGVARSRALGELASCLAEVEPRLRRALVARYGVDLGSDVAADAIAWAWEHADRMAAVANPAGYLYRVAQSSVRSRRRRDRGRGAVVFPAEPAWGGGEELPGDVFEELARLKPEQRVAVVLVHGYGFSYRDVADVLEVSEAAVTNHVYRGLRKLRSRLGGSS
jgi:RNA polymerase sigma-70 factor (ECF subfamily)